MKGQWIGAFGGTTDGSLVINIDEQASWYEGIAYMHPTIKEVPKAEIAFRTEDKNPNFKIKTNTIYPIHPITHERANWEQVKGLFPAAGMSKSAEIEGTFDADQMTMKWTTDVGYVGNATLPRSQTEKPSVLESVTLTWEEFIEKVNQIDMEQKFLFRGQSEPWRLRTAFHRYGRFDLHRFLMLDIPILHKHLSARTRHLFNMTDPHERGAFLSLAQHHGYPTNLLDWTWSPYVAAFFAFRGVSNKTLKAAKPEDKVRIFIFDAGVWTSVFQQILAVSSPMLHVSLLDVLAIENERLIPQQAMGLVSSVDDIETHIKRYETDKTVLLRGVDIPITERDVVLKELRFMGITAGSLFPGLDGACEELKDRYFRYA